MISLELAKKLKEAGFPQNTEVYWEEVSPGKKRTRYIFEKILPSKQSLIAAPSISELIKEVKKPIEIILMPNGFATILSFIGEGLVCRGKSLEGALVNFWLETNEKSKT